MSKHHSVLILDFGSQYTQLIARRTRELGVFSEIRPCTIDCNAEVYERFGAIILSGGPSSVTDEDAPRFDPKWLECTLPILGICYGLQLTCFLLGAKLGQGKSREYGKSQITIKDPVGIFDGFTAGEQSQVWMSHGDHVEEVPKGFELLATSQGAPIAAIGNADKKIYALQFHPEVVHSVKGKEILKNFLFKISGLEDSWRPENFIDSTIADIQKKMEGGGNVICGISGGVDSTVAAMLVHKALGKRLTCIFVDNGLLRTDERGQVKTRLSELGLQLIVVDATDLFLKALAGVTDPEQKRKVIGKVFIDVFDAEAKKIPNVTHLVQGTLYPDVIESVSVRGPSVVIKSHHNVGGLPEKMALKLLEPLRELFKDEVRAVGRTLQAPPNLIERQPFPGPGLAVRCLGEIRQDRLDLLRKADSIFQEEIRNADLYGKLWQSFCVLLPVKSVGVMGDGRTYEETCALRAVTSLDGMTADWYFLPEDLLRKTSNRIINEVKGINRVVLDISSKPPATIEWE